MAIIGSGGILPPGFDPGHGIASPSSTPIIIPTGVTVDPAAVAAVTYTHPIVLFIGGKARIFAENIIFGPYIEGGIGSWANSFGFTVPIGTRLSPVGDRALYEIAFDSKVAWASGSFVSDPFTFRFYPGTFTQGVDPLETAKFPGSEIAYRTQMVIFFEGVNLAPFDGKIPGVGAVIGDITGGADPDAGIDLGAAFENFGRSIWVGYSAGDFEITGVDDRAPAILCGEMPAIMELLPAAARFYRWDIVRGGVLRVIDHGLVSAPDVVFTPADIIKADIPLRFDRAASESVPRVLELVTPDPDYDYMRVPSLSQRSLAVSVSSTADKETVTLPIVMDANTRQALVAFAHYSSEHERLSCSFTVGSRHLGVEPGDLFSFSGIGAAFPQDIFHVTETNTGANFTKQITGRMLLRTAEIEMSVKGSFVVNGYVEGSFVTSYPSYVISEAGLVTHASFGDGGGGIGFPDANRLVAFYDGNTTTTRYLSSGSFTISAAGMYFDHAGNLYSSPILGSLTTLTKYDLTGASVGTLTPPDASWSALVFDNDDASAIELSGSTVTKFTVPAAATVWAVTGPGTPLTLAKGTDASGNIWLSYLDGSSHTAFAQLSGADGSVLNTISTGTIVDGFDTDDAGNLFVSSRNDPSGADLTAYTVTKYSAAGATLWSVGFSLGAPVGYILNSQQAAGLAATDNIVCVTAAWQSVGDPIPANVNHIWTPVIKGFDPATGALHWTLTGETRVDWVAGDEFNSASGLIQMTPQGVSRTPSPLT